MIEILAAASAERLPESRFQRPDGGPSAATALRPGGHGLAVPAVDVVPTGHDHAYERFAPLDAAGRIDHERGIRQFVVGIGGKSHQRERALLGGSEVRDSRVYGVLRLRLRERSYHRTFIPEAGRRFTDTGARSCH